MATRSLAQPHLLQLDLSWNSSSWPPDRRRECGHGALAAVSSELEQCSQNFKCVVRTTWIIAIQRTKLLS
jgi:hypothetical protein